MKHVLIAIVLALVVTPPFALAHHSKTPFYDLDSVIEIEGEVTRILWRNPHIRFWVDVDGSGGQPAWEVESTPPGILERHGIGPEIMAVGQTIRIAGNPGRDGRKTMDVTNILAPDGREVLIQRGATARWSDQTIGWNDASFETSAIVAAEAAASGIFRVWSRDFGVGRERTNNYDYPLTAAALSFRENYDPVRDNPISGCTPKGMPYIMGQPYPVQFTDEGDRILMRIEEYDLHRTIHLTEQATPTSKTPLGHSVGRWEGSSLIVSTTGILLPYLNTAGILLSNDAEIVERFDLSQDETRLDYLLTITDPATFTEPVARGRYWLWRPGETIQPFECVE
jgi:hypothetical protein